MAIATTHSMFKGGWWVWEEFEYTGSGQTWSHIAGINAIYAILVGGGGGGGGGTNYDYTGGCGGGGGQVVTVWLSVTGDVTVTIGDKGSGGSGVSDGGDGEDCTLSGGGLYATITALGGVGGESDSAAGSHVGGDGGGAMEAIAAYAAAIDFQNAGQGGYNYAVSVANEKIYYPGPGIGSSGGAIGGGGGAGRAYTSSSIHAPSQSGAPCAGFAPGGIGGTRSGGGGGSFASGGGGRSSYGNGYDANGYGGGGGGGDGTVGGGTRSGGDGGEGYCLIGYTR